MLCQTGQIAVQGGNWYKLTFRARSANLKAGTVEVALVNTGPWENAGLSDVFPAQAQWEKSEFVFRAERDVPAARSRLQFWFKGTGTLWLADVVLTETTGGQEWFPQIPIEGFKNLLPNSSFECGTANWGSYTWGLRGWGGNLYRLEGEADRTTAEHGQHSLRIALTPQTLPVFWFDYYEPVREPVKRVLAANQGWLHVEPGQSLTLSAFLRSDIDAVVAQLAVIEAPDHRQTRSVRVSTNWERQTFTFTPSQPFLFVAVGLDLEESRRDAATLLVDAVQLERGDHATEYAPRQPLEAFIESETSGNLFTDPQNGATLTVRAFNDSPFEQRLAGRLTITDFNDQQTLEKPVALSVPANGAASATFDKLCQNRCGFFRATLSGLNSPSLRFALIEPSSPQATDSPFGFNHAYPWDFLVQLARRSGIVWWRDWSAKWQTVEPRQGQFDFTTPDAQIRRVLGLDSEVEVLLPFPSATWSTSANREEVEKAAGQSSYLQSRLPLSFAPKDNKDFGQYAAAVVRRYGIERPRPVTTYQVLNEPVYTDYALPRKFGYTLEDYLRLLKIASQAIKQADPHSRVVGGISTGLEAGLTREFIERGGLELVDIFDLHMYDAARPAESFEEPFSRLEALMRAHGGQKPVWITEWGCYADDDPACLPQSIGDATMNRCRWSSERAAAEHIVEFATVAFAHGVRKIFFHAGTCGTINGPDAGGVLFEYGGAPRKMLPAIAAFSRLVGVPDECARAFRDGPSNAYIFRVRNQFAAVVWRNEPKQVPPLPKSVRAFDIMGNQLPPEQVRLSASPVYLLAGSLAAIEQVLAP